MWVRCPRPGHTYVGPNLCPVRMGAALPYTKSNVFPRASARFLGRRLLRSRILPPNSSEHWTGRHFFWQKSCNHRLASTQLLSQLCWQRFDYTEAVTDAAGGCKPTKCGGVGCHLSGVFVETLRRQRRETTRWIEEQ